MMGAVFVLLFATAGLAGCADDGGLGSNVESCEQGVEMEQPGEWGGIRCQEASGPATLTDTFDCEASEESAVGGSLAAAQEGSLQMTVEDAGGQVVFQEEYSAGAHPVGDFIGEGEAGEWTITVEFSDDWESGQFGIGAGCMYQGEDGQTEARACQTNDDISVQDRRSAQIFCEDWEGERTLEAWWRCDVPEQGFLNWGSSEMESGQVHLVVQDAGGDTVTEVTFGPEEGGSESFEGGTAGEWTIVAELSADFSGSFQTGASCPEE